MVADMFIKSEFFINGGSKEFNFTDTFQILIFYHKCDLFVIYLWTKKHYLKFSWFSYRAINFLNQFKTICVG